MKLARRFVKHNFVAAILMLCAAGCEPNTGPRPELAAKNAQQVLIATLKQNTLVDPGLPNREGVVAEELFAEREKPNFDWRHLSRSDWASVAGNTLVDHVGNKFTITYSKEDKEWKVEFELSAR